MNANQSVMRGSRNPNAALTAEQVLAMREAYSRGATQGELCRIYGVSITTVQRIVTWKTWAWLKGPESTSPFQPREAPLPAASAEDVEKSAERLAELSRSGKV